MEKESEIVESRNMEELDEDKEKGRQHRQSSCV